MRTEANEATISPGRGGVGGGDAGSARRRAVGLFTFFLLVIAAFWIQKPIRTSKFLTELGPEALPLVKLGTALLILPVMLIYSSLAAHYRRHTLVYWCTGTFVVTSIAFWWLLSTGAGARWTPYAFFFYVDIFNSVLVALFWSFANDLTSPEDAKRTYGIVGAGGIVGGVVGSAVTGWTVETLGAPNLLLVCAGLLVVIAALAWWLAHDAPAVERPTEPRATVREALAGARLTFASSYLLSIAGIVVAYEIVSNIIDYQFNTAVAGRFQSDATMAAFLGRFSTASSGVSLLVQLGLTSWILHRWGPRVGLLVLPLALGLGSAGFLFEPVFVVVAATFFSDAALGYSLNQSSKEVLYTPTDEATKYQAKAFIDMFLMRLAKAGSSLLILAAMAWWLPGSEAVHRLGVISLVMVVVWALLALRAGRGFEREAPAAEADERAARPTGPAPAAAVPRAV
jgi:AAA family ATP:ADP antiporter